MDAAIIAFDDFTDIDVFLMWDLLNRVRRPDWRVRILGSRAAHTSQTGLTIPMHGPVESANEADVVLFTSGPGTRKLIRDAEFLSVFRLDPERQMIGSMCSGALVLAALGLLQGKRATTYPTTKGLLESFGVTVVEEPFVREGNVATAGGCLAAQYLVGWVIERHFGVEARADVIKSVQPVGEGLSFADADILDRLYKPAPAEQKGASPS